MTRVPRSLSDDPEVFPQVSVDFAAAIGYVSLNWAIVEGCLAVMIGDLFRLSSRAQIIITSELSAFDRVNIINAAFFEARNQQWVDAWHDLAAEFDSLRNLRNEIIHSSWQISGPEHVQLRYKVRGKIILSSERRTADQILDLADQIIELTNKLARFRLVAFKASAELAKEFTDLPPLVPNNSRGALNQSQARAAKKARKEADRKTGTAKGVEADCRLEE